MIKKILVTGSNGTIGTRLCEQLMEQGYTVVGVDWKKNKWHKKVDAITKNFDLRDKKIFDKLDKDFDLVIHLAANARVWDLVVEPDMAMDNILTTYNVIDFTRRSKIKRFMFASSREVYGNTKKIILKEHEADMVNCESPYSASKISGEALTRSYQKCYGMEYVIFRFSNVYGMYDDSDRVVPLFIRQCKNNQDLTIFGKDKALDFTYIDDNIHGIITCIKNFDKIKNDTINIAYGKSSTIIEVANMIRNKVNPNVKIILKENRTGEVVKYTADISKMKKILYQPKVDIKEGIQRSIEWYEKNIR
jgi:nucleoside-diphosphate-sugar epimerase